MIIIVLLNDPAYWSLVFSVCCACATTFYNPEYLLICDWLVSSFFFQYNNNIVLIVAASVWWSDGQMPHWRPAVIFMYCLLCLLRQINFLSFSLFLSLTIHWRSGKHWILIVDENNRFQSKWKYQKINKSAKIASKTTNINVRNHSL